MNFEKLLGLQVFKNRQFRTILISYICSFFSAVFLNPIFFLFVLNDYFMFH